MKEKCERCWDVYHFYEYANQLIKSERFFRECAYAKEYGVICLPLIKLLQTSTEEAPSSDNEPAE